MESVQEVPTYRDVLRDRKLTTVLLAFLISQLGDGVAAIALPLLVYASTGSATATALMFAVNTLPNLLFGLWSGALADRLDRHRLVVVSNLGQGSTLLLVPFVDSLWLVGVIAFVSQTLGVFAAPATNAALPGLAGEKYQQLAAFRSTVGFTASALGPVLGGALVGLIGTRPAIVVDAVTFFVAAALIAAVRDFDRGAEGRRAGRLTVSGQVSDIADGLRYLRGNTVALGMTIYAAVGWFALPLSLVGLIPYVTDVLGRSPVAYGFSQTCYGVGAIVGLLAAGRLSYDRRVRLRMLASVLGYGSVGLVLGLGPGYYLYCALLFAWGVSHGPEAVLGEVLLARSIPDEMRGRLYSASGLLTSVTGLLGYLVAGPAIDRFGPTAMMAVAGAIMIVQGVVAFGFGPLAKAIDATTGTQTEAPAVTVARA